MEVSEFRNKTRLKKKEIRKLKEELSAFSSTPISFGSVVEKAYYKGEKFKKFGFGEVVVYITGGDIFALEFDGTLTLSLKGILRFQPKGKVITVDMGAVPFLYNGADVMAPGIVDFSRDFKRGEFVWVKDEKYGKPLVLGIALLHFSDLENRKKGKAVQTIHHIGDFLWQAHL
ncbi:MAG TPA: RNA-binding protein [Thermoplasmata archaeon]|nr:RNA-binding protein [Thermoplasmata archaeon]